MAGLSGSSDDFSKRLNAAMDRARSGAAPAAGSDASQNVSTPPIEHDDVSRRLNEALARARGELPPATSAAPATPVSAAPGSAAAIPESTGPVGDGDHVVRNGECISYIAKNTGHFWETIWNDPANADLKETRRDPNVLLPGDRVTVPELSRKEEAGATEQRHRFRRLGEPSKLRLRLTKPAEEDDLATEPDNAATEPPTSSDAGGPDTLVGGDDPVQESTDEDVPKANAPFVLLIDGVIYDGTTDEDGRIEVPIPGNARLGRLMLQPGTEEEEVLTLRLGTVSPITAISGVKQRLANLTFDCGDFSEEETPALEAALRGFQAKHGLPVTGQADQDTRARLLEEHGC